MTDQGWISLHRKIQDSIIYSDSQAVHLFIHLLLKANHTDKDFLFNGALVSVKRGQVLTGRKALSTETGINESKIQRLLKTFESCKMIEQQTNNKNRLISITNYHQYQGSEHQANIKRTTDEQQMNTNNNVNNDNNVNKDKPKAKRFVPPSIDECKDYFVEKGSTHLEAQKFFDYYESNGWKVGKNKMKKWKSSASGWISRQSNFVQPSKPNQPSSNVDDFLNYGEEDFFNQQGDYIDGECS